MRVTEVVFMQGEEASSSLTLLEMQGEEALLESLKQCHDPVNQNTKTILFLEDIQGKSETTYKQGDYMLSYNLSLGYCGLIYIHKEA